MGTTTDLIINSNTWFYTLSTIVQALASVFALSATFLVFKLQTLEQELRSYRNKAIKTLVYIEGQSETKFDQYSLLDISKRFVDKATTLIVSDPYLGIGPDNYFELKNKWVMMVENGFAHVDDKTFNEYFVFLLTQSAGTFKDAVNYRIRLYMLAFITGVVITFTMIFALGMLSGLIPPDKISSHSLEWTLKFVSGLTCLGFIGVMYTAFYAIFGDKKAIVPRQ
jgi:hypothetical protein